MSTPAPMKIHACMIGIMQAVQAIAKDRKNDQQGFKFRGIDDIYSALHYIFAEKGVICLPQVDHAGIVRSTIRTAKGTEMQHISVPVTFVFMAIDGSSITCSTIGEAMDNGDKSTAKSMSMAHKTALIQTFLIPVVDVADGDAESYFVDPKEELEKIEKLREQVLTGNGGQELNDDDAAKLLKKRREIAESAKIAGDEGMTMVTPVQPDPVAQAKPAKAVEKEAPQDPPFESDVVDWRSHKISVIKVPEFKDALVGAMEPKDVLRLFKGWVIKQGLKALIDKGPEFAAEARALDAAMKHHFPAEHAVLTAPKQ